MGFCGMHLDAISQKKTPQEFKLWTEWKKIVLKLLPHLPGAIVLAWDFIAANTPGMGIKLWLADVDMVARSGSVYICYTHTTIVSQTLKQSHLWCTTTLHNPRCGKTFGQEASMHRDSVIHGCLTRIFKRKHKFSTHYNKLYSLASYKQ